MNKIFKVVWSKTKECYVVVSEVAKNNGGKKKVLASVLAGLAMVGAGAQVQAYSGLGGHDNPAVETLAVGPDTWANQEAAVAVGMHNNANGQPAGKHSVAIGSFSNANGEISIAMGGVTNASGKMSVAVGYRASATDEAAVALGNMVSADKNSTGVGPGATASGTYAFAGGYQSETTGISGVAIGDNAKAKAARAMAIGGHAEATAEQAIAIGSDTGAGNKTTASKKNAIAVGHGATASGLDTAAIGTSATASGQSSVALGNGTQSTHLNTTAIGSNVQSTKTGSIGIGGNVESIGDYSVAIGSASQGKTVKAVDYATAVGGLSNAAERAAALGAGANAAQARSVAVGYKATANTADGVAIGSTSVASTAAGVQGFDSAENRTRKYTNLTGNVQTSTLAAVSVGDGSTVTRQITGLAAGKEDTDAVNVAQLKNVGVRVGADTNTATIGTNKVAADFLAYNGQLNIKGDSNRVTTVSENDANGKDANVNVKFDYDGLVKAKTGSAVTVDQKTDAAGKTYFEIDAAAGSKTVVADGKNTTVTGAGTTASPYKVNVEGALTGISSITNNGGGKIEFTTGGTTISGGPVNVSNNKITGVANGDVNATSTDAVNGSQLHAVKAAERHIAPTTTGHEYTVDSNGDVTMTYLDGNNDAVANEKAVIKGIAKNDLSNITNEGKKEITKLGTIVKAGDNVNVSESSDATTGRTTYTVSAVTPAVYTKADGTKVYKRPDGTFTTNSNLAAGNNVDKGDVITSFMDGNGNTTGGNMVINNVGSAIKNAGSAGDSFLTKLDAANTATPNAAVNVSDLKNTADGLTNKGLKFDANEGGVKTNKLGSTVTVQGSGALTAGKAYADEYNTANIRTKIDQDSDGNTTINVGLAKALKDINSISNGNSSITLNSNPGGTNNTPAVSITGGNVDVGGNNITNLKSGGDTDSNAANIGDVKKIASDTDTHIKPGTYTVAADKTVTMTYVNGKGETVKDNGQDVVAKIDLSGLPTGGTSSTEKVKKAANGANDTNIAEVNPQTGDTYGAANATYEVSVSRNAVKDAAREAVTVNNGGTTTGGTYTADANNPISVTATPDNTNHNTTYAVTFDGDKAAKQIPLTYKATNGTTTSAAQTVKLDKGLNFTGGDYTTASVGADGKVTFDVTLGTTPTVTDGKPGVPGQAGAAGKDGIATVKTVVDTINNSGWKANAKANGGKLDGNSTATVVKPGDQVNFAAGKNLTVKQDLTGEHTYTYSLNKDLKDLTSVEIGGSTIKTDGDHITITSPDTNPGATPGATVTNKVANLGDEKHIKPDTYAVANDGSVTLKYVDGNGKDLTETTKITGIAKKAKVINGKNTTVEEGTDAVDNSTTYKVNVKGDLTGISSITNGGTNNGKISFGPNKTVTVDGDHSITLNASTGTIGGLQNKTFDPTNITSGQAATEDQLKSVHDALKANERHIAPTTVATGSTETKGGTANAGGTANVYKYDAASKTVTLTYNDGNGHAVTDTKAVIDFSALNTGGTTASTWTAKTSAENTTAGSEVGKHAGDTSQVIGNQNSVDFQAGKNMTVKQTNDGNGNTTINYALDKNLDVESVHVGKDGKDGKIGIDGKDGVDGLDGTNRVDIHVEKGAKGVDGTDGHDGVNGHNGKDGMTRIVYEDKGGKQEVATLNDGMKYAGDDAQGADKTKVIAKKLNETLDIIGGANKADLTTDNIGVNNDGNGKLLVQLSKKLKGLDSVQTKTVELGDHTTPGGTTNITYNTGDKRIEYTTPGVTPGTTDTKKVATTDDIWTIQGNGTDVAPVNGKVNVKAGENILITTPTTADGSMTINAVTPAVYTDKNGNKLTKDKDGKFHKPDGTEVAPADVITSIQDAAGNVTGGNSIVNNVGSAIKNAGNAGDSFLTKLDAANTATPNAAVNVSDLKNTADGLTNKGLKFDANEGGVKTNKLGSTVTVQGSGALTAGKAYADEYNTANIRTNIEQGSDGNTTINVGLAKELKDINSISNGGSSITISNVPTGATTPAVTISGGNLSMGNGTTNNKIVNLAPGTGDNDAVNVKQLKDTELHITPGTYTPGADKKVKLTYTDGNNTVVNGKEAVIDLSGLATGGTTSTEKVQKAADATDDKNIAEVGPKSGDTFGAANATYEVSVSRNAVKDAAREAVTINNGGTKSGTTYTPNADNPITVTPKEDAANHNTTYEVTFDGNKAAKQIPLTYKATNGTTTTADQTVKLDKGLNFTGGDYTTASVGADGKVTFDVTLGTTPTVTDGKPGVPGQAGAAGKDGIATVKTVVDTINNSGWKANAKANGGKLDGNSTATVVKPGDQVNFAAGKNLTVKQDLTGEHTYTYSLNKDLKDLTSVEIGGSTIKTDGDHITITSPDTNPGATPGATVTNKVANLGDEKHIKPDTYAVANDGSVTLKYVDGNGKDLTETTKITGIAKKAKVINGKNTTVEEGTDAVDNSTTYKVNVKGDLTGISSITNDGTNNGKISFGPNKTVTVDGDHSITLNASTGKIGGLQNLTFDPTNFTSGQAATEDQLKSVHDTLKANERHIAPTTVATGSTETKGGTANAGGTANVYKYDAASKTVTLTYNDGNGHAVTDTKAVIDFSALNTGGTTASTWTAKTSAENTTAGSEVGKHAGDTSQVIGNQNSVDFQAGKNMTVKQTNDGNGNTTINYALDKNLDVESVHVGKDGKDGKIGIDGKDGVDGLDGTNRVDIHVEKGAKGVDGTDGHDGVNGHNGKDGMTRIVYEDKGGKQEVATLNDGLKFTGNNESTVNNHKLNTLVKVQGEGTKESTVVDPATGKKYVVLSDGTTKFESAKDNIAVEADGTDTLTVKLNKNLKGLNSIQLGGNTIQSNGDNITFTTNGGTTKTVATTDQLWTIQANGTDVPAKSGKVNLVAGDHITITPDAANGKMTISATGFGSMDGFNVKTSAESATVGTHAGDTTENIKNGKTVDMQAGKNLVVTQTNDGNGNTTVNYALNKDVDLGTNGSLKAGDTTVNKDGVTIANGPSITKTGVDAGDKKITNVADGAVNATSKDAVNGSQLKKYTDAAKTTVEAGDDNVKVETDNSAADGHTNYKVSLKPVVEIGDTHKVKIDGHTGDITGLTNVDLTDPTFATKGRAATEEQLNKVLTEAKKKAVEKVQAGTAAAGDTNIATVAPKAGDTFGAAGATYEVSVSKNAVKDAAKEAVKVTSASPAITVTPDTSVAHETTYKVGFDGDQAATQIPLTYKQNGGSARTVKLSDGLNFIDGTNTKARTAADGKVTFDVMGDLTGITSISNAAGGPKMTFGGNSINVTNGDLNMGGNKITNLGKGTATTDAATVGQLTKVTSNNHSVVINKTTDANGAPVYDLAVTGTPGAPAVDPRIDQLGEEIGRVGAQGAALSALKPIQYDPLEPTQIMAGYGNYRGNSAVALGVAHYKNESTLIHGGVSWAGGSSHMMANAGVTWKVGNRDSEAAVADRYRKGPISSAYAMQQEMAAMKAQNAGLKGEVSDLKAENEQMKAQIAAMMAKLGL